MSQTAALLTYIVGTGQASETTYAMGTAMDSSGNVYVTGYTNTCGVSLVGVSGGQTKTTTNQDAYVAKYDTNGVLQWGQILGGTGNEYGYGIASDANGNVYVTGDTQTSGFTLSGE